MKVSELADKAVTDDEIAYEMLSQLSPHYDNFVMKLYKLTDADFTVE